MRTLSAAAMLAASLHAGTCLAQTADTPENRLSAAVALQQAMGGNAALVQTFTNLRPALIRILVQSGHLTLAHAAEMVDTVELPELQKHAPDLLAAKARIYAKYFDVHDLQVMMAFYRSPTGQKALAEQSAIAADTLSSMQPLIRDVQAHVAELAKKQQGGQTSQPAPAKP